MAEISEAIEEAIRLTTTERRPPDSFTIEEYRAGLAAAGLPVPTHKGAGDRLDKLADEGKMDRMVVQRDYGPPVRVYWVIKLPDAVDEGA